MIFKSFKEAAASGMRWQVIYADPPWHFSGKPLLVHHAPGNRYGACLQACAVTDYYKTMPTKELCKLPVITLSTPDAVLLIWTTNAHLAQALQVGNAWGFKYVSTQFVWEKRYASGSTVQNLGAWGLLSYELCLLFTKGTARSKLLTARNIQQKVVAVRGRHSQKPEEVPRRIEAMFSFAKKIELFARSVRPTWDAIGNEAKEGPNDSRT